MSLGWMAQTSFYPRKSKDITGVSNATVVQMKAELLQLKAQGGSRQHTRVGSRALREALRKKESQRRQEADDFLRYQEQEREARLDAKTRRYQEIMRDGHTALTEQEREEGVFDFEAKRWGQQPAIEPETSRQRGKRLWEYPAESEFDLARARQNRNIQLIAEVTAEASAAKERIKRLRDSKRRRVDERVRLVVLRRKQAAEAQAAAQPQPEAPDDTPDSDGDGDSAAPASDDGPPEAADDLLQD